MFLFCSTSIECYKWLGQKLTWKSFTDNDAMGRVDGTADAKSLMRASIWFVPNYTPNTTPPRSLSDYFVSRSPTELDNFGRPVSQKYKTSQKSLKSEADVKKEFDVPINVVSFQESVWRNNQKRKNDVFVYLPALCAFCSNGAEKDPDAGINPNYRDGNSSQVIKKWYLVPDNKLKMVSYRFI